MIASDLAAYERKILAFALFSKKHRWAWSPRSKFQKAEHGANGSDTPVGFSEGILMGTNYTGSRFMDARDRRREP